MNVSNGKIRLIEGFNSLTKQQIFDMAAKHVLSNGRACYINGACSYAGIGCAASVFLHEEVRSTTIGSWSYIMNLEGGSRHESQLIQQIQWVHDDFANLDADDFIEQFVKGMREIADRFSLNTEVLDKA